MPPADAYVGCSQDARCFIKNDSPINALTGRSTFPKGLLLNIYKTRPVCAGTLSLSLVHLASGAVSPVASGVPVSLPVGAGAVSWVCASGQPIGSGCTGYAALLAAAGCKPGGVDCVLTVIAAADVAVV